MVPDQTVKNLIIFTFLYMDRRQIFSEVVIT